MKFIRLFLLLYLTLPICGALVDADTSLVTKSVVESDNPLLLKILQSVDEATSNEYLFDVTLKLLKSLCFCMRETLKEKQRHLSLRGNTNELLTEDDYHEDDAKVFNLYKNIYNKTCFSLRHDLVDKIGHMHNTTGHGDMNCGKTETVTETTVTNVNYMDTKYNNETDLKSTLFKTLILTRNFHNFTVKFQQLYKKHRGSISSRPDHGVIFLITLYPENSRRRTSNTIRELELDQALYSNAPIDITILDSKREDKQLIKDQNEMNSTVSECKLQSIYVFLIENDKRNLTKKFRLFKRKSTIRIYIEMLSSNFSDYLTLCCDKNTQIPECTRENVKTANKTVETLQHYRNTISKIKKLVNLYKKKASEQEALDDNKLSIINSIIGGQDSDINYETYAINKQGYDQDLDINFNETDTISLEVSTTLKPIEELKIDRTVSMIPKTAKHIAITENKHKSRESTFIPYKMQKNNKKTEIYSSSTFPSSDYKITSMLKHHLSQVPTRSTFRSKLADDNGDISRYYTNAIYLEKENPSKKSESFIQKSYQSKGDSESINISKINTHNLFHNNEIDTSKTASTKYELNSSLTTTTSRYMPEHFTTESIPNYVNHSETYFTNTMYTENTKTSIFSMNKNTTYEEFSDFSTYLPEYSIPFSYKPSKATDILISKKDEDHATKKHSVKIPIATADNFRNSKFLLLRNKDANFDAKEAKTSLIDKVPKFERTTTVPNNKVIFNLPTLLKSDTYFVDINKNTIPIKEDVETSTKIYDETTNLPQISLKIKLPHITEPLFAANSELNRVEKPNLIQTTKLKETTKHFPFRSPSTLSKPSDSFKDLQQEDITVKLHTSNTIIKNSDNNISKEMSPEIIKYIKSMLKKNQDYERNNTESIRNEEKVLNTTTDSSFFSEEIYLSTQDMKPTTHSKLNKIDENTIVMSGHQITIPGIYTNNLKKNHEFKTFMEMYGEHPLSLSSELSSGGSESEDINQEKITESYWPSTQPKTKNTRPDTTLIIPIMTDKNINKSEKILFQQLPLFPKLSTKIIFPKDRVNIEQEEDDDDTKSTIKSLSEYNLKKTDELPNKSYKIKKSLMNKKSANESYNRTTFFGDTNSKNMIVSKLNTPEKLNIEIKLSTLKPAAPSTMIINNQQNIYTTEGFEARTLIHTPLKVKKATKTQENNSNSYDIIENTLNKSNVADNDGQMQRPETSLKNHVFLLESTNTSNVYNDTNTYKPHYSEQTMTVDYSKIQGIRSKNRQIPKPDKNKVSDFVTDILKRNKAKTTSEPIIPKSTIFQSNVLEKQSKDEESTKNILNTDIPRFTITSFNSDYRQHSEPVDNKKLKLTTHLSFNIDQYADKIKTISATKILKNYSNGNLSINNDINVITINPDAKNIDADRTTNPTSYDKELKTLNENTFINSKIDFLATNIDYFNVLVDPAYSKNSTSKIMDYFHTQNKGIQNTQIPKPDIKDISDFITNNQKTNNINMTLKSSKKYQNMFTINSNLGRQSYLGPVDTTQMSYKFDQNINVTQTNSEITKIENYSNVSESVYSDISDTAVNVDMDRMTNPTYYKESQTSDKTALIHSQTDLFSSNIDYHNILKSQNEKKTTSEIIYTRKIQDLPIFNDTESTNKKKITDIIEITKPDIDKKNKEVKLETSTTKRENNPVNITVIPKLTRYNLRLDDFTNMITTASVINNSKFIMNKKKTTDITKITKPVIVKKNKKVKLETSTYKKKKNVAKITVIPKITRYDSRLDNFTNMITTVSVINNLEFGMNKKQSRDIIEITKPVIAEKNKPEELETSTNARENNLVNINVFPKITKYDSKLDDFTNMITTASAKHNTKLGVNEKETKNVDKITKPVIVKKSKQLKLENPTNKRENNLVNITEIPTITRYNSILDEFTNMMTTPSVINNLKSNILTNNEKFTDVKETPSNNKNLRLFSKGYSKIFDRVNEIKQISNRSINFKNTSYKSYQSLSEKGLQKFTNFKYNTENFKHLNEGTLSQRGVILPTTDTNYYNVLSKITGHTPSSIPKIIGASYLQYTDNFNITEKPTGAEEKIKRSKINYIKENENAQKLNYSFTQKKILDFFGNATFSPTDSKNTLLLADTGSDVENIATVFGSFSIYKTTTTVLNTEDFIKVSPEKISDKQPSLLDNKFLKINTSVQNNDINSNNRIEVPKFSTKNLHTRKGKMSLVSNNHINKTLQYDSNIPSGIPLSTSSLITSSNISMKNLGIKSTSTIFSQSKRISNAKLKAKGNMNTKIARNVKKILPAFRMKKNSLKAIRLPEKLTSKNHDFSSVTEPWIQIKSILRNGVDLTVTTEQPEILLNKKITDEFMTKKNANIIGKNVSNIQTQNNVLLKQKPKQKLLHSSVKKNNQTENRLKISSAKKKFGKLRNYDNKSNNYQKLTTLSNTKQFQGASLKNHAIDTFILSRTTDSISSVTNKRKEESYKIENYTLNSTLPSISLLEHTFAMTPRIDSSKKRVIMTSKSDTANNVGMTTNHKPLINKKTKNISSDGRSLFRYLTKVLKHSDRQENFTLGIDNNTDDVNRFTTTLRNINSSYNDTIKTPSKKTLNTTARSIITTKSRNIYNSASPPFIYNYFNSSVQYSSSQKETSEPTTLKISLTYNKQIPSHSIDFSTKSNMSITDGGNFVTDLKKTPVTLQTTINSLEIKARPQKSTNIGNTKEKIKLAFYSHNTNSNVFTTKNAEDIADAPISNYLKKNISKQVSKIFQRPTQALEIYTVGEKMQYIDLPTVQSTNFVSLAPASKSIQFQNSSLNKNSNISFETKHMPESYDNQVIQNFTQEIELLKKQYETTKSFNLTLRINNKTSSSEHFSTTYLPSLLSTRDIKLNTDINFDTVLKKINNKFKTDVQFNKTHSNYIKYPTSRITIRNDFKKYLVTNTAHKEDNYTMIKKSTHAEQAKHEIEGTTPYGSSNNMPESEEIPDKPVTSKFINEQSFLPLLTSNRPTTMKDGLKIIKVKVTKKVLPNKTTLNKSNKLSTILVTSRLTLDLRNFNGDKTVKTENGIPKTRKESKFLVVNESTVFEMISNHTIAKEENISTMYEKTSTVPINSKYLERQNIRKEVTQEKAEIPVTYNYTKWQIFDLPILITSHMPYMTKENKISTKYLEPQIIDKYSQSNIPNPKPVKQKEFTDPITLNDTKSENVGLPIEIVSYNPTAVKKENHILTTLEYMDTQNTDSITLPREIITTPLEKTSEESETNFTITVQVITNTPPIIEVTSKIPMSSKYLHSHIMNNFTSPGEVKNKEVLKVFKDTKIPLSDEKDSQSVSLESSTAMVFIDNNTLVIENETLSDEDEVEDLPIITNDSKILDNISVSFNKTVSPNSTMNMNSKMLKRDSTKSLLQNQFIDKNNTVIPTNIIQVIKSNSPYSNLDILSENTTTDASNKTNVLRNINTESTLNATEFMTLNSLQFNKNLTESYSKQIQNQMSNEMTQMHSNNNNSVKENSVTPYVKVTTNENNDSMKYYISSKIDQNITIIPSIVTTENVNLKTVKYNTYKPISEDDISVENKQQQILLDQLNYWKQIPRVKNTPSCELINNLSLQVAKTLPILTQLLKSTNCTLVNTLSVLTKNITNELISSKPQTLNPVTNPTQRHDKKKKPKISWKSYRRRNKKTKHHKKSGQPKKSKPKPNPPGDISRRANLNKNNKVTKVSVSPKSEKQNEKQQTKFNGLVTVKPVNSQTYKPKVATKIPNVLILRRQFKEKTTQRPLVAVPFISNVILLKKITPRPTNVVLHPTFIGIDPKGFKGEHFRPKPIIKELEPDYFREDFRQHHKPSLSWRDKVNFIQGILHKSAPPGNDNDGGTERVLERPWVAGLEKPKFLRDRIDSIRNYVYSADFRKSTARTISKSFFISPEFMEVSNEEQIMEPAPASVYRGSRKHQDAPLTTLLPTTTKTKRTRRSRRTIFFLSPTVPYNRYF